MQITITLTEKQISELRLLKEFLDQVWRDHNSGFKDLRIYEYKKAFGFTLYKTLVDIDIGDNATPFFEINDNRLCRSSLNLFVDVLLKVSELSLTMVLKDYEIDLAVHLKRLGFI